MYVTKVIVNLSIKTLIAVQTLPLQHEGPVLLQFFYVTLTTAAQA